MELLEKYFDTAFDSPTGIQELRSLILKLAMMGKLTTQDPKDQPASELLKEIQAEKERLIAEGRIKRQKPLPEIKPEEIPYELPEGWVWCQFGNISMVVRGGSPRPAGDDQYYNGNIPFLKVADLTSNDNIYLDSYTYTIKEAGLHKTRFVESGTLMLTNSGATLGIPKICNFPTTFNDGIAAFLNLHSNLNKIFLYFFLKSKSSWFLSEAARGQGQPNLNTDIISSTILALPPLNEQKRIVAKINELMARCDEMERLKTEQTEKRRRTNAAALHRLIKSPDRESFTYSFSFITRNFSHIYGAKKNVEELKKAVLQLAMMGKLVPQDPKDQPAGELLKEIQAEKEKLITEGKIKRQKPLPEIKPEEIPYELPAGWVWSRVGIICDLKTGATPSRSNKDYFGGNIKWLVSGDIHKREIVDCLGRITPMGMESSNCKILPINSVMIALNGQGKTRATVAILKTEAACNQSLVALIPYTRINDLSDFIYWNLHGRYQSLREITGHDKRRGLNMKIIGSLIIPIPPLNEQKRIVSKINELMSLCDNMIEKIDGAGETREKLLQSVLAKV